MSGFGGLFFSDLPDHFDQAYLEKDKHRHWRQSGHSIEIKFLFEGPNDANTYDDDGDIQEDVKQDLLQH